MNNEILTKERLDLCRASREKMRGEYFKGAIPKIGKEAVSELENYYSLYDEKLYILLADLWDQNVGGFYFSRSGRDTEAFLPDIESTVQALVLTEDSGLTVGENYIKAAPESMRTALSKFVHSLLDKDDGYFYHPQWGKNITMARRGRDLRWALELIQFLGEKTKYPTAVERLSSGESNDLLPEHLRSIEKWKKFLEGLDLETNSYWSANLLQSQSVQIRAAGDEYVKTLFSHLRERQLSSNGLWEKQTNYASLNGLMKLSLMYTLFGETLPNAAAALSSAIDVAMSDEEISFCCQFYNPLITIHNLLKNMRANGNEAAADELNKIIISRAPEFIRKTRDKVSICKKDDGGFSYNPDRASFRSQKAPVGLGLRESDVNATTICATGCATQLCADLSLPNIPLFSPDDGALFYDLIKAGRVYPKINPKPEWFDDLIDPAKITETYSSKSEEKRP